VYSGDVCKRLSLSARYATLMLHLTTRPVFGSHAQIEVLKWPTATGTTYGRRP